MGEFVGVDPANLRELTARLQRLHDVLARQTPVVQQKMQKWGSEIGFAALPSLVAEALDDARDMTARTGRAYELAREKGWSPLAPAGGVLAFNQDPPPLVQLDWTALGQSAGQARHDAAELARILGDATASGTSPAEALRSVAESLRGHLDDADYLAAFWDSIAPLAAGLARRLHDRGPAAGPLLDASAATLLAAFGAALAAASRLRRPERPGDPALSRAALDALESGDPWSVGMLLKYGPPGSSWDPAVLAGLTRALLDARHAGKISWPSPRQGIGSEADAARYQREMAGFDPVAAVLTRAAENGEAARQVLGDPHSGLAYARMLVSDSWHTPGYDRTPFVGDYLKADGPIPPQGQIFDAAPAAAFLRAAVSAPRGTGLDAQRSAWSVVHIVTATSDFAKANPGALLPHEIRQALLYTADRYLPDFAKSVGHDFSSMALPRGNEAGNPWVVVVRSSHLEALLDQALQEPEEFGTFTGMMNARVTLAVAATIKDPSDADYVSEMAGLYGLVQRLHNDQHFVNAQLKDEEAARDQTALALFTGSFGALSFSNPWGPGAIAQFLTGTAAPAVDASLDTGHALEAVKENADAFRDRVLHIEVPVVQGLVVAGVLRPPNDAPWFRSGMVVPDAHLVEWISEHAETRYGGKSLQQWIRAAQEAMRMQQ
ncbi:hypothetical protein GCM10009530_08340 [Microbispora corallina]|uniref:Uncharacterized protein n=1 Tax=Microbispora corallina TaxID=83302 RepID=A0ABQ4FVF8_9ACTN|nr:hypothetical protein [Microbispora corallina]GIH38797.1 hypothetical protein Mco01_17970 [Microbispora corallina]